MLHHTIGKTFGAKGFDIYTFFEDIRDSCTKKRQVITSNESLLVYGIPKEKLNPIEEQILSHLLKQIDNAFENLLLLKTSITARETMGAPLHIELIMNYAREKTAKVLGDLVIAEAEQKTVENYRAKKEKYHGLVENIPDIIKKFNNCLDDTGKVIFQKIIDAEYLEYYLSYLSIQERKNYDDCIPHCGSTDCVKETESHLAILKTLPPIALEEYELNPYKQLTKLIDNWTPHNFYEKMYVSSVGKIAQKAKSSRKKRVIKANKAHNLNTCKKRKMFDDTDIFYLAKAFFIHFTPLFSRKESSLTLEQIVFLAECSELPLKLNGYDKHEKLIRCIFHFWKEHCDKIKTHKEAGEEMLNCSPEEKQKEKENPLKLKEVTYYMENSIIKERITPEILTAIETRLPTEIEQLFAKK